MKRRPVIKSVKEGVGDLVYII